MKTGTELERVVYEYWAKRFGRVRQDFVHSGTLVIKEKELAGTGKFILYHIGKMSIVRVDPTLAKQAGLPDGYDRDFGSLTVNRLQELLPVELESTLLDSYLDPDDFECFTAGEEFTTRQLDLENDKAYLLRLYETCTEDDLDAADIIIEEPDPIIFGIFAGSKMVAYASHRYWDDVIADIGVLIHPKYRSRGLGKAVVSTLCEWCIQNDIVPMYRVFTDHVHSRRIPEAIGVKDLVAIKTLKVTAERDTAYR
ncbi:MAG: GNAT family N-acetyltransferase [Anaerolineae bacterium]|jgi:GNAT superfamily N-acetyltransferase|nr:GNAT family N-acetyltransferase [Anaerolineae bacterium]MBT7484329.1 GNAT family N-acetyltransferase [Candidatus Peregrinibacteria bacterium]MBT4308845.1 GNAT family N-acetyltransferase [Anaerolineae bacterium]MBT4457224.1 GNAT family N-acetyltransferase [Anaerolineae bacterium]MBT4841935.1 GNAT family N-acetyltransferase [Anaerolineae bacterium]